MNRIVDLQYGTALVVSDLHGEWEPYVRYRDHFIDLWQQGFADHLIFLGDVIHGYGPPEDDYSLGIVLDIMRLRTVLGADTVIMLLGNHELPHIYGIPISKGEMTFTPRFEHTLGDRRDAVITFFKSLPFMIRTAGGALLTHAGAASSTAAHDAAQLFQDFSHDALLEEANRLLARKDVSQLLQVYGQHLGGDYEQQARELLAVSGPDDRRYLDLLRGFVVSNLDPEWSLLWDLFFTQCEAQFAAMYGEIVDRFLHVFSAVEMEQRVLITGHIVVQGGHEIVAHGSQLRLASWSHARPNESGEYLRFDVAAPIQSADDLTDNLYPIPVR